MPTKRLFLASLLLMPIGAQARFDAPAFFNACITDLTVKFAKEFSNRGSNCACGQVQTHVQLCGEQDLERLS